MKIGRGRHLDTLKKTGCTCTLKFAPCAIFRLGYLIYGPGLYKTLTTVTHTNVSSEKIYICVVLINLHLSIVLHICRVQYIRDDIVCICILRSNSAYSCILQVHSMLLRPPHSTSTLAICHFRFVSIPIH